MRTTDDLLRRNPDSRLRDKIAFSFARPVAVIGQQTERETMPVQIINDLRRTGHRIASAEDQSSINIEQNRIVVYARALFPPFKK